MGRKVSAWRTTDVEIQQKRERKKNRIVCLRKKNQNESLIWNAASDAKVWLALQSHVGCWARHSTLSIVCACVPLCNQNINCHIKIICGAMMALATTTTTMTTQLSSFAPRVQIVSGSCFSFLCVFQSYLFILICWHCVGGFDFRSWNVYFYGIFMLNPVWAECDL